MRIKSSTVDAHQFTAVRRRGYDPDEVDAVMKRLAGALREYEDNAAELEQRLREAEESSEAIHRTFVAAQRARDEMIVEAQTAADRTLGEAEARARQLTEEAESRAERVVDAARQQGAAITSEATAERDQARGEAARIRAEANEIIEVADAKAKAMRSQADEVVTSAIAEAEAMRDEAARVLRQHQQDAKSALGRATEEAERIAAESQTEAEKVLTAAKAEAADQRAANRKEAEALVASAISEAKNLRARVKAEVDELKATRIAEVDELKTVAEHEAAELRSKAEAEAESLLARAAAGSEESLQQAKMDAADRVSAAQGQSDRILDDARARADEIVTDSRVQKEQLDRRVKQLRTAVTDIERELKKLSDTAMEKVAFVGGMIELESRDSADVVAQAADRPPPPVPPSRQARKSGLARTPVINAPVMVKPKARLAPEMTETPAPADPPEAKASSPIANEELTSLRTVAYPDPDGSGRLPAARGLVAPGAIEDTAAVPVATEAAIEKPEPAGPVGSVDPPEVDEPINDSVRGRTIYQRRSGGLRDRIKREARKERD